MKWFFEWFDRKLEKTREDRYGALPDEPTAMYSDMSECEHINIKLYKASGGWVVHNRYYDSQKDTMINKLHVVNSEQDLGEALAKILTFELL